MALSRPALAGVSAGFARPPAPLPMAASALRRPAAVAARDELDSVPARREARRPARWEAVRAAPPPEIPLRRAVRSMAAVAAEYGTAGGTAPGSPIPRQYGPVRARSAVRHRVPGFQS